MMKETLDFQVFVFPIRSCSFTVAYLYLEYLQTKHNRYNLSRDNCEWIPTAACQKLDYMARQWGEFSVAWRAGKGEGFC